jgi:hypothetical protein
MAEQKNNDDVDKILTDLKSIEERKQALIVDLLQQRADAIKMFDEKLAKLGWKGSEGSGKTKKSHHKQPASSTASVVQASAKGKTSA